MIEVEKYISQLVQKGRIFRGHSLRLDTVLNKNPVGCQVLSYHSGLEKYMITHLIMADLDDETNQQLKERYLAFENTDSPHLAKIYDLGFRSNYFFAICEDIPGIPLSEKLKESPLDPLEALQLLLPVAETLVDLWSQGIIYHCLHPMAIKMAPSGRLKLELPLFAGVHTDHGEGQVMHNILCSRMGCYWAPEEVDHSDYDFRADVFSFGVILYEALTGEAPFFTYSEDDQRSSLNPQLVNPYIDDHATGILQRLLESRPEKRCNSPEHFLSMLRELYESYRTPNSSDPSPNTSTIPLNDKVVNDGNAEELDIGSEIGNCVITKELGAGSYGKVYKARHKILQIDVAIKVLQQSLSAKDKRAVDLFLREARTAARIYNENVTRLYEAGLYNGNYVILMEYVSGGSLLEKMLRHQGKIDIQSACKMILDVSKGLCAAEKVNIVHRDIKPDNIMIDFEGNYKIADMGLSKSLHHKTKVEEEDNEQVLGSPSYMSPEAILDPKTFDIRGDIYSLGTTAYHALSGRLIFSGEKVTDTLKMQIREQPLDLSVYRKEIPEELNAMVMKMVEKNPNDRYQSPQEIVEEIHKIMKEYSPDKSVLTKMFS